MEINLLADLGATSQTRPHNHRSRLALWFGRAEAGLLAQIVAEFGADGMMRLNLWACYLIRSLRSIVVRSPA